MRIVILRERNAGGMNSLFRKSECLVAMQLFFQHDVVKIGE
jgi:hypothetical protein